MARPRGEASQAVALQASAMVASATRFSRGAKVTKNVSSGNHSWQAECYRHYAICGEARFAARFFGNALSRCELFVDKPGNGKERVTTGNAPTFLAELAHAMGGQPAMLAAFGVHLTVAGECYVIGRSADEHDDVPTGTDIWEIVSPMEVAVAGDLWSVKVGRSGRVVNLTDEDAVIRVWIPMPGARNEADSPFRALLPVLAEIEWTTRHIFKQISSRLAGSGVLLMPNSISFPAPTGADGQALELGNQADSFMLSLAEAMSAALDDPGSPENMVPLIVTAEGDDIDKAKLLEFWSELDDKILEMRNDAIRRFAQGMDLPPEQVLGMSSNGGTGGGNSNGVSHWGAWQIEESTIKLHVEPMLEVISSALTHEYLLPLLSEGAAEYVSYDTSALRLRPDRSRESLELYDRGLIRSDVVLRENGFDPDTEAMSDEELKTWYLRKIATGSATPEQVQAALEALGVVLNVKALPEAESETRESRPDPTLDEHPSRPRTPGDLALIAACDSLVWRALEKAGNRYINAGLRGKDRDRTIDPTEFYLTTSINGEGPGLLGGAFNYAPRVLEGLCDDPASVMKRLENYCLALFHTQTPHSRTRLAEYLNSGA